MNGLIIGMTYPPENVSFGKTYWLQELSFINKCSSLQIFHYIDSEACSWKSYFSSNSELTVLRGSLGKDNPFPEVFWKP